MPTHKEPISVVWLKRDLRLDDNEAIQKALVSGNHVLLFYVFEPMLLNDPHYNERHWNFIKQSLEDMNERLVQFNTKVLTMQTDMMSAFNKIQTHFKVVNVFSHQETGILVTFNRDKIFKRFCKNNFINWQENINNGIYRGLQNREQWVENWERFMNMPLCEFQPKAKQFLSFEDITILEQECQTVSLSTLKTSSFQKGGTTIGLKYLESFLNNRYKNYMFSISKPLDARKSCSRLSPYLAWGNLSVRQVLNRHWLWMFPHQTKSNWKPFCPDSSGRPILFKSSKWNTPWKRKVSIKGIMTLEKTCLNSIKRLGKLEKLVYPW